MIKTLLGTITQTKDPITQKNALQVLLQQTQNLNKVHSIDNSMRNNNTENNTLNGNGSANHTENNIGNVDAEEQDGSGSSDDEN